MRSDATINVQLNELARHMRVPYFRSISYMLSMSGACQNESSIVNLDNATRSDTHWIAYAKRNSVVYFDSFDNLRPPMKLVCISVLRR